MRWVISSHLRPPVCRRGTTFLPCPLVKPIPLRQETFPGCSRAAARHQTVFHSDLHGRGAEIPKAEVEVRVKLICTCSPAVTVLPHPQQPPSGQMPFGGGETEARSRVSVPSAGMETHWKPQRGSGHSPPNPNWQHPASPRERPGPPHSWRCHKTIKPPRQTHGFHFKEVFTTSLTISGSSPTPELSPGGFSFPPTPCGWV